MSSYLKYSNRLLKSSSSRKVVPSAFYFIRTLITFVPAFMMAAHAFEAGQGACVSVSSMVTTVPKLLQGSVVLYCSIDAAGTWSVASLMSELLNTILSVEGMFPA